MYRAKNTFSTGKLNFKRGQVYESIPEGYEGYFDITGTPVKAKKRTATVKAKETADRT